VAAALVLETTVGDLLRPPVGETAVSLGGKDLMSSEMLFAVSAARPREDMNFAAIQETLSRLEDSLTRGRDNGMQSLRLARDLDNYLMARLRDGGLVTLPTAGPGVEPVPQNREEISQGGDK